MLLWVVELASSATDAGSELLGDQLNDLLDTTAIAVSPETAVGEPAEEIVRYADEQGLDHAVVVNHGRGGISRVLLGSVAETVARRSALPVTTVR